MAEDAVASNRGHNEKVSWKFRNKGLADGLRITIMIVALAAAGTSLYFIWIWLTGEQAAYHTTFIKVAAVGWAIGTPTWFLIERSLWTGSPEKLDRSQDHVKDFWLGIGAIVLVICDHAFMDQKNKPCNLSGHQAESVSRPARR